MKFIVCNCDNSRFQENDKLLHCIIYYYSQLKVSFYRLQVIRHLKRVLPNGPQRKREVDYVLDRISETMTPMHYHFREVIFSTFNLVSSVDICLFVV